MTLSRRASIRWVSSESHPVVGRLHRPLGVGQLELGLPVGRLRGGQLLLGPPDVGPRTRGHRPARDVRRRSSCPRRRQGRSPRARRPAEPATARRRAASSSSTSGCSSCGCSAGSSTTAARSARAAAPVAAGRTRCATAAGPSVRCGWSAPRPGRPTRPAEWLRPPTERSAVGRMPASAAWACARSIRSAMSRSSLLGEVAEVRVSQVGLRLARARGPTSTAAASRRVAGQQVHQPGAPGRAA